MEDLKELKRLVAKMDDKLFELVEGDKAQEAYKLAKEWDEKTQNRFDFLSSLNY